jgi:putative FmdB family regulatory protein
VLDCTLRRFSKSVPLYEYQCARCGRFEIIQRFSDDPLRTCPTCGDEVQKMLSAPAIQFKGTGWYITDYARKGGGGAEKKSTGDAAGTSSGKTEGSESASKGPSKTEPA